MRKNADYTEVRFAKHDRTSAKKLPYNRQAERKTARKQEQEQLYAEQWWEEYLSPYEPEHDYDSCTIFIDSGTYP